MAFVRSGDAGNVADTSHVLVTKNTSEAMPVGRVVAIDRANNRVALATSSTDSQSANCYFGVTASDSTASETTVEVIPFEHGQVYDATTNANTASTQVFAR